MWTYRQIGEDGEMGYARDVPGGVLFAWGAGVEFGVWHPGGWCHMMEDAGGDLDEEIAGERRDEWTAEQAMSAADSASR